MNKVTPRYLLHLGRYTYDNLISIREAVDSEDNAQALFDAGYLAGLIVQKADDLEPEDMEGTGVSLKELYEIAMQTTLYISSVRDMIIGGEIAEAIKILENTQEYVLEKMRVYEMKQKEVSE